MKNSVFFLLLLRGVGGIFCIFVCILSANAQFQKPDVSMPSPNAASLGLYGEVPVSLYTGTPNIDIPLYTLQEGKLKVPISLSYNASGVRVNQHPGWVGLNWNLNAGGAINRIVKDIPDETKYGTYQFGYFFSYGFLNNSNWETKSFAESLNNETSQSYPKTLFDTEPDEFSFNFMGYSGKFYLNHEGKWIAACDQPVKVEVLQNSGSPWINLPEDMDLLNAHPNGTLNLDDQRLIQTFYGFAIITEDGTRYEFGGTSDCKAIEFSKPFFNQYFYHWLADTWYLTKIKTREGQSISFEYEVHQANDGKYTASLSPSIYYSENGTINNSSNFITRPFSLLLQIPCLFTDCVNLSPSCTPVWSSSLIPPTGPYGGSLIRNVYLKTITGQTGKIKFQTANTNELGYTYRVFEKYYLYWSNRPSSYTGDMFPHLFYGDTGSLCTECSTNESRVMAVVNQMKWKKLTGIEVTDLSNNPFNKFSFEYNDSPSERLMLNRINTKDIITSSCVIKHDFEYFKETGNELPEYLDANDQTDHWGFFNKNSFPLIQLYATNANSFINHKEASDVLSVLRSGTLKKITYPTGGYTEFNFEKHDFYKYLEVYEDGSIDLENNTNSSKMGGIRIQSINSFDGSTTKTKTYEYKYGTESSGISSGKHQYLWSNYEVKASNDPNVTFTRTAFSYQNLLPTGINSLGSHIGYREVKEKNADNSYTIYKYTNFESDYTENVKRHMDEAIPLSLRVQSFGAKYDPRIDRSFERGKLLFEGHYKNPTTPVLIKKITYKRVTNSNGPVRAVNASYFTVCNNTTVGVYLGFPYKHYTDFFRPETETVQQYDQADPSRFTTDVTEYETYNSLGMPTKIKTTRSGKSTITYKKYAVDFAAPENSDADVKPLWKLQQLGATGVLVEQVISNNDINYTNDSPADVQRFVDGYLNIFRYDDASNVQIWQTRRYVPSSPSTSFAFAYVSGNNLVKDAGFSKVILQFPDNFSDGYTTYGEPKLFKGADGIWNGFTWGSGNETGLVKSKSVGVNTSKLQTTSYTYSQPLVGVSQITDPNNFATKYEYDGFNRLKVIKDYSNNIIKSYSYNLKNSNPFSLTVINIGQSQSGTQPGSNVPLPAWSSNFVTVDAGPELDYSTQSNPSIFYSENTNKVSPRFWTIYVAPCNLGTSGAIGYDLLLDAPETGPRQSFNTIENNAVYLMFANRDNFTELYAQNNPFFGFYADVNNDMINDYNVGFPKGLYKLVVRYWSQKGLGAAPAVRTPEGVVLAIKEYWFRIQSKNGIGTGAP